MTVTHHLTCRYVSASPQMISGEPNAEVTIDGQKDTCYTIRMATENEYLVEHFSLDFDHQGERDIILLGVGMANEIAQCSMMNIFYSEIPAPDGCDILPLMFVSFIMQSELQ